MIVGKSLFQEYIDLSQISNTKIAECLTELGFETKLFKDYQKIDAQLKVGKVVKKDLHPDFQKIFFCLVDIGNSSPIQVVCGAKNFQVGDKVVYAPVGATIGFGIKMQMKKFAHFNSYGMFCSFQDLDLAILEERPEADEIIILPKEASAGEGLPLKYFAASETLFKITIPWNQPETKNVFILAKYLQKNLQLNWLAPIQYHPDKKVTELEFKQKWQGQEQEKSLEIKNSPPLDYLGSLTIKNLNWETPLKLRNILKLHELKPTTNLMEDLLTYLKLDFPQIKHFYIQNQKKIVWNKTSNQLEVLPTKNKEDTAESSWETICFYEYQNLTSKPLLTIYAQQKFAYLYHLYTGENFFYYNLSNYAKNCQLVSFDLNYLNQLLGFLIDADSLKAIFANTDYKIVSITDKKVSLEIPKYYYIGEETKMAEEIMRFYQCHKIPFQTLALDITTIEEKEDLFLTKQKQLVNYLLGQNIYQVKNFVFWEKNWNKAKTYKLTNNHKLRYLQTTVIPNLIIKSQQFQENIFTIAKTFHKVNQEEKIHLGVIWKKNWLNNPLYQEKITTNKTFLIAIVGNILTILNLAKKKLLIKKNPQKTSSFSDYLEAKTEDPLLSDFGIEKLYYQQQQIGEIGEIVQKKANKYHHYFFLELDLTTLIEIRKNLNLLVLHQIRKLSPTVYRDFSLLFEEKFLAKIYCQTKDGFVTECNHYQLLVTKIKNSDPQVVKVELIDQYQDKKVTFRVWKKPAIDKNKLKKLVINPFEKIEKMLKSWKNAKIV